MKENDWEIKSSSFAQTVRLVENYVRQEIERETEREQLYYHTIDHALAVKRRSKTIFQAIEPVLAVNQPGVDWKRLECLLDVCAIAHDMVQQFSDLTEINRPRQRIPGISEAATFDKLIAYIKKLNQTLSELNVDDSILFSDRDLDIIQEGILATICQRDPQAGKVSYSFSNYSIYQPYLYDRQSPISLVGNIIALADLGTLGMEGIEPFIYEGILVFLEDNLDLKDLIIEGKAPDPSSKTQLKARLLNMTRFMVSLALERYARFELEIAAFSAEARHILRSQVFIYLNSQNIAKVREIVPINETTSLDELISFFCLNKSNR